MKKIFTTTIIAVVVSLGHVAGQSTTTTSLSQGNEKMETITRTETQLADGRTITTVTHTSTANMAASFGVKATAGLADFVIRDMGDYKSTGQLGTAVGVFLKLESRHFALQYELLLRYRTCGLDSTATQTKTDYTYWGLELPILLMGQIPVGSGKIFIGAGPYASVGLDAVQSPGNIDLYRKDPDTGKAVMQRWDFGLSAIAGYEFKNGISIHAGYQAGLLNVLSAEKDNSTMRNQWLGVGVGYKF